MLYNDKIGRIVAEGEWIVENDATVRNCAKEFNVSKSTVHNDVNILLKDIDPALWEEVRKVLERHLAERPIRGGEATKQKYLNMRKKAS